jgi:hypothetical protein
MLTTDFFRARGIFTLALKKLQKIVDKEFVMCYYIYVRE